ncbi:MAG: cyclase, partial [Actinomycetota bacterium]|nr:cyclase [Actinomycetota bacterium]
HVMTKTLLHPDDVEGWRGEIHDGRVVEQDEEEEPVDDTDAGDEDTREDTTEESREGAGADRK